MQMHYAHSLKLEKMHLRKFHSVHKVFNFGITAKMKCSYNCGFPLICTSAF